jgi:hypothetical protein
VSSKGLQLLFDGDWNANLAVADNVLTQVFTHTFTSTGIYMLTANVFLQEGSGGQSLTGTELVVGQTGLLDKSVSYFGLPIATAFDSIQLTCSYIIRVGAVGDAMALRVRANTSDGLTYLFTASENNGGVGGFVRWFKLGDL